MSNVMGTLRIAGMVRRAGMERPMSINLPGLPGDVLEGFTSWYWGHHAAI